MNPTVSVIMIFLDPGAFFREAVDSVLLQSDPGLELELLLADDGSTDGSSDVARSYAAEHPGRVRVLRHPDRANGGMSASRNLGLCEARGELVAFLDADDVWDPGHLAHEVEVLRGHPEAGMVCGGAREWRGWEDPSVRDTFSPLAFPAGSVVPPPDLLAAVLRRGLLPHAHVQPARTH